MQWKGHGNSQFGTFGNCHYFMKAPDVSCVPPLNGLVA